ncbi:ATP-binding cassette domain-containing protein, partial [Desulfococcus sp.]|uniref:ATP-binding cassette domain-containing protein n=1 Tax=Desulfococcus sp. TaxID=2025834 RepID=UPI003593463A
MNSAETVFLAEENARPAAAPDPLVRVEGLTVRFDGGRGGFWGRSRRVVHAVNQVSFEIYPGETLGLVGESGSGKSTTGRAVLRRVPLAAGRIFFRGREITHARKQDLRPMRRHMQLVFQDPYASLNPRMRIADIIAEPLIVHRICAGAADAADRVALLLELVG